MAAVIGAVGTFAPIGLGHSVSIAMMAGGAVIGLGLIIGGAYVLNSLKSLMNDPTVVCALPPEPNEKDPTPVELKIPTPAPIPDYGSEYNADLTNTIQNLDQFKHIISTVDTSPLDSRNSNVSNIETYFGKEPTNWTRDKVLTFAKELVDAYNESNHLCQLTCDKQLTREVQKIEKACNFFRQGIAENRRLYLIFLAVSDLQEVKNDPKFSEADLNLAINEFKNVLLQQLQIRHPLFNQAETANIPDHTDLRTAHPVKAQLEKYLESKRYRQIFHNGKTFKDPSTLSAAELKLFVRDLKENYDAASALVPLTLPNFKQNQLEFVVEAIKEAQNQYQWLENDTATQAVCDAADKLQRSIDSLQYFDFVNLAVEELRNALNACFEQNDLLPGSSNALEFGN